MPLTSNI
jgi:hypothetical protein